MVVIAMAIDVGPAYDCGHYGDMYVDDTDGDDVHDYAV